MKPKTTREKIESVVNMAMESVNNDEYYIAAQILQLAAGFAIQEDRKEQVSKQVRRNKLDNKRKQSPIEP